MREYGGAEGEHGGAEREQGRAEREHIDEMGVSGRAKRRHLGQPAVTYWPGFGEVTYIYSQGLPHIYPYRSLKR